MYPKNVTLDGMKLQFVLGRSGRGKTEYILKQIKALAEKDKFTRVLVIVPEQATFRMERELIEKCDLPGLFNISVVSFDRLVHEILAACGGRTLAPLDFIGKTMVVRSLLDEHRNNLSVFGKSASMPGFEIKMTEMLTELKRQDVSLADLEAKESLKPSPITGQKLADIALLFSAYRERMAGQKLDSEDMISLAIEKAESQNYFNGAHVFVDGFDLLTHQLLRLLTTAIRQSAAATITFKRDVESCHDHMVFAPEEKLYIRIGEAAKNLGIQPEEILLSGNSSGNTKYASPELLHLEQNLFAYPPKIFKETPTDIHLTALDSQSLEVKETCARIIDLVGQGYRFRDIAVCVSDIDAYREDLSFSLRENNIPFFMDAKTKLMDTAFAEFLISLLDFLLYKDATDFLVHIQSGFLDTPPEDLCAVENYIRRWQIKGYTLSYGFKHADAKTDAVRKALTGPVFELMRAIKSAKTAEGYGEDILTYLIGCRADENALKFAKKLEDSGDLSGALVFSQVFEKIVGIIRQACVMFKGEAASFESFVSAVKAGLEAVEIAVIPPSTDDVLVGDFSRTAFPPVKALFILGLNDGKIPSSPDASAVLTDAEKSALEGKGLRVGYRDRFYEERIRIYSVFSAPTEKLFLSYSSTGEKEAAKPSVLVGRIQKLFPKISPRTYTPRETVYTALAEENLFRDLSLALNQKLEGLPISPAWRDIFAHFENDTDWQPRIRRLTDRLGKIDKKETLAPELARELYSPLTASVSRAEKFYTCPMQYFLDYGIRPQKDERFQETPLDMGNFLHDCLHAFVLALRKENLSWGTVGDADLNRLAENVCDTVRYLHHNGILAEKAFAPVYERLKLDFFSALRTVRGQLADTDVTVYAAELSLKDTEYLNFTLEDGTELALTCKVDRVDVLDNGAAKIVRIVDYKLSGKTASMKDVYYGLNIQLLIYLKFVLEFFRAMGETVIIGGAFYFDLSLPLSEDSSPESLLREKRMNGFLVDDAALNAKMSKLNGSDFVATQGSVTASGVLNKRTKTIFTADEFDTLFSHCEWLMQNAFTEILSGEVTPIPFKDGSETACKNCDYRSICLFDDDLDAYRNIQDKTISDFEKDLG